MDVVDDVDADVVNDGVVVIVAALDVVDVLWLVVTAMPAAAAPLPLPLPPAIALMVDVVVAADAVPELPAAAFIILHGAVFMMASHCDKSPLWHSTSNSIVSRNILFSSFSHSRFSEKRRYFRKKEKKTNKQTFGKVVKKTYISKWRAKKTDRMGILRAWYRHTHFEPFVELLFPPTRQSRSNVLLRTFVRAAPHTA